MGPPWGAEKAAEAPRAHGPGTEVRPVHPGGGRSGRRGLVPGVGAAGVAVAMTRATHSNRAPRGPGHTGGAPSMAAAPGQTPSPRDLTARLTPHLWNGATVRGALSLGRLWDPVTPPRAVLTGPRRALAVTSILGAEPSRGDRTGSPQAGPAGSYANTLRSPREMHPQPISSLCLTRRDQPVGQTHAHTQASRASRHPGCGCRTS